MWQTCMEHKTIFFNVVKCIWCTRKLRVLFCLESINGRNQLALSIFQYIEHKDLACQIVYITLWSVASVYVASYVYLIDLKVLLGLENIIHFFTGFWLGFIGKDYTKWFFGQGFGFVMVEKLGFRYFRESLT